VIHNNPRKGKQDGKKSDNNTRPLMQFPEDFNGSGFAHKYSKIQIKALFGQEGIPIGKFESGYLKYNDN
jgi:hypothetical protein